MAACLIFKSPLKVISKPPAENAGRQAKRPFSDVHGHFHDNAGQLDSRTSRTANSLQMRSLVSV
jgi:hypothetical protein